MTFEPILKNGTFQFKTSVNCFWATMRKLGYFKFQNLVTLEEAATDQWICLQLPFFIASALGLNPKHTTTLFHD